MKNNFLQSTQFSWYKKIGHRKLTLTCTPIIHILCICVTYIAYAFENICKTHTHTHEGIIMYIVYSGLVTLHPTAVRFFYTCSTLPSYVICQPKQQLTFNIYIQYICYMKMTYILMICYVYKYI